MGIRERFAARAQGTREAASSHEAFVLATVRAARDDDDVETTADEVRKDARKRRRRLGLASFAAGPFAGAAAEVSDLYSETATVCDVIELHRLELSDLDVGAHMLVLWNLATDLDEGRATLDGSGVPIAALVQRRLATRVGEVAPDDITVIGVIKSMWRTRGMVGDVRDATTAGSLKRVFRAGSQAKDLIERAEAQLGVTPAA